MTDEVIKELKKVGAEFKEDVHRVESRMDSLEKTVADIVSQTKESQTKKETRTEPPEPKKDPEPDDVRDFVLKLKTKEEEREKRRREKARVRTPEEVNKQAAGVLSKMLMEVQGE